MGRVLKRVPLDFDWQLNQIWNGYINHTDNEDFEPLEPPTGNGYQIWETTTEGSPISPVFETKDKLINYLIQQGYSEGAAEQFAEHGWAPSGAIGNGRIYNNIESLNMARPDEDDE